MTDEQGALPLSLAPTVDAPLTLNRRSLAVRAFVDRYMPAYELWLDGVKDARQKWHRQGLEVRLGWEREVDGVGMF